MFDKLKKRFSRNITPPTSAAAPLSVAAAPKVTVKTQTVVPPPSQHAAKGFIMAVLEDPSELERCFEEMIKIRSPTEFAAKEMRALDTNTKKELVRLWIQQQHLGENMADKENVAPTTRKRGHSDASRERFLGGRSSSECPNLQKEATKRQKLTARFSHKKSPAILVGGGLTTDTSRPQSNSEKVKDPIIGRRSRSASVEEPQLPAALHNSQENSPRSSHEFVPPINHAIPERWVEEMQHLKDVVTKRGEYDPKTTSTMGFDEKLHGLRTFLRAETIERMLHFIQLNGLTVLADIVLGILDVEWREAHETKFLLLVLQCVRIVLKTPQGANRFHELNLHETLFPRLMRMQFSWGENRRAFFKFEHRQVITELFYMWLRNVTLAESPIMDRAETMLGYLRDFPEQQRQLPDFVARMHKTRCYTNWAKELKSTTRPYTGTPWMYWHKDNVINPRPVSLADPYKPYSQEHAPTRRPELICSSVRTHTETLVSQYVAANIDLLNTIIASLPDKSRRNALRQELLDCGFEDLFGHTLRLASQSNFSCINEALQDWVTAARADKWTISTVTGKPDEPSIEDRSALQCLNSRDVIHPPALTFSQDGRMGS